MKIYNNGLAVGTFFYNDECFSGSASRIIWNTYISISRINKKNAIEFMEVMKNGGDHSGFTSLF
jgi:hypothetical protein